MGRSVNKRFTALAMAFLMIVVVFMSSLSISTSDSVPDGYVGDAHTVNYHYGTGEDDPVVSVTYYGTAIAEYNPEFWDSDYVFNGEVKSGTQSSWTGKSLTMALNATKSITWRDASSADHTKVSIPKNVDFEITSTNTSSCSISESGDNVVYYYEREGNGWWTHKSGSVVVTLKSFNYNEVFGGWSLKTEDGALVKTYDPGDILGSNVTDLYVNWVTPDVFYQSKVLQDDEEDLRRIYTDYDVGFIGAFRYYGNEYDVYQPVSDQQDLYSVINIVNSDVSSPNLSEGTYRSTNGSSILLHHTTSSWGTVTDHCAQLSGDVIIDNINLRGTSNSTTQHNRGLYANGHMLVIGTGVTTTHSNGNYVEIYGGMRSGDTSLLNGTDVRIFSGVYSNVVGGGGGPDEGFDGYDRPVAYKGYISETHVLIAGDTAVLEAVMGGSTGGRYVSGTVSVEIDGTSVNKKQASVDRTYITIAGKAKVSENQYYKVNGTEYLETGFSTVIGGSRFCHVGESHVTITGDSEVFTVQGGGREALSRTDSTDVTVSGCATVLGVVCGSVTDGRPNEDAYNHTPVGSSSSTIKDHATIEGSVYGGGLDIYRSPDRPSTEVTSIHIINCHRIESVYGGGFRGSVGSEGSTGNTVTIIVDEGMTGTIGSIYGGGSGGPDPFEKNESNTSTGPAKVNGSVSIEINGGTVGEVHGGGEGAVGGIGAYSDCAQVNGDVTLTIGVNAVVTGDVYGGGKGASGRDIAKINGSTNVIIGGKVGTANGSGGDVYGGGEYGSVTGSTEVEVLGGATVHGNVYGGGKGDAGYASQAVVSGTTVVRVQGTVKRNVYGGGSLASVSQDSMVLVSGHVDGNVYGAGAGSSSNNGLASVVGSTSVTIEGVVGQVSSNGSDGGDVYGGGQYGAVNGTTSVLVQSGSSVRNVYGGGQGVQNDHSFASVAGATEVTVHGKVTGNVYGGGDLAKVAGATVILVGAEIESSVFGGGNGDGGTANSAGVSGNTDVQVRSSTVGGSVYGGGNGVKGNGYIAIVYGSASVSVSDGSSVDGSVFGGGNYGRVGPDPDETRITNSITVSVTGASTSVEGSVYGGGYGETNGLATYALIRTVTINCKQIGGSVFGGSNFGDDNCLTVSVNGRATVTKLTHGTSEVHVSSGNLNYGSAGNVYGAGYRGYSNFDSNVYLGTFADATPVSGTLRANSVFGGSSVGASFTGDNSTELMLGDAHVSIGGEGYTDLELKGDVFGSGDYCEISGTSEVVIDNMIQGQGEGLLSLQKTDDLRIVSSTLRLAGNLDGTSTGGSPKLSLNKIGHLTIEESGGIATHLVLDAATSQINGYSSVYQNGVPEGTAVEDEGEYNSIRMNSGTIFSILGVDNCLGYGIAGAEPLGQVSGTTLFQSDTDDYYGAFIIAGMSGVTEGGGTDFVVAVKTADGIELQSADHSDFEYSFGWVRAWFISGAYGVQSTAIIDAAVGSTSVQVDLPKIRNGSEVAYVGYYTNPVTSGAFNVLPEVDLVTPGKDLSIVIGKSSSNGRLTFNNGSGLDIGGAGAIKTNADPGKTGDVRMDIALTTASGQFTTSGYVGSVTIHMAEFSGNIVTDVFDVVIGIYLRIDTSQENLVIEMDVPLRAGDGIKGYSGSVDVYLPILSSNATGNYYISGLEGLSMQFEGVDSISVQTKPSNISKSGWLNGLHDNDPLYIYKGSEPEGTGQLLGIGGVYSPVIGVNLHAATLVEGGSVQFHVVVYDEVDASNTITVKVILNVVDLPILKVTIEDIDLLVGEDGTASWGEHEPLFVLSVEHNSILAKLYIAYIDSEDLYSKVTTYLASYVKLNDDGTVMTGSFGSVSSAVSGSYKVSTVPEFLDRIVETKPDVSLNKDSVFDYHGNSYGWYDIPFGYTAFKMSSQISHDLSIYSGYSIVVNLVAVMDDGNGLVEKPQITIDPSQLFPGVPGTRIDLTSLKVTLQSGYKVDCWMSDLNTEISNPSSFIAYETGTVYAKIVKIEYKVTVEISGGNAAINSVVAGGTALDNIGEGSYGYYYFDSGTISVSLSPGSGYHVASVDSRMVNGGSVANKLTYAEGSVTISTGSVAGDLYIVVTLSDTYSVTISLPEGADNEHFGLVVGKDGSISVVPAADGGRSIILEIYATTYTLRLDPSTISLSGIANDVSISVYSSTWDCLYVKGQIEEEYTFEQSLILELYISYEWALVKEDAGYTCIVEHVYPDSTSSLEGDYGLHTGDSITLVADSTHTFDASFTAKGVSGGSGSTIRTYTVVGFELVSGDDIYGVEFGAARLLSVTVTITVHFGDGPAEAPEWNLYMNDVPAVKSKEDYDSGTATYTLAVDPGFYTFRADFDGYQDMEISNVNVTLSNSTFTIHAVPSIQGGGGIVSGEDVEVFHIIAVCGSVNGSYDVAGLDPVDSPVQKGGVVFTVTEGRLLIEGFPDNIVGTYVLALGGQVVHIVIIPITSGTGNTGVGSS